MSIIHELKAALVTPSMCSQGPCPPLTAQVTLGLSAQVTLSFYPWTLPSLGQSLLYLTAAFQHFCI